MNLIVNYNPQVYKILYCPSNIPLLVYGGVKYKIDVKIEQLGQVSDNVRVILSEHKKSMPLFTVMVQMPTADVSMAMLLE